MMDLISRQAAIEAIEEYADRLQMVDWKENPGVPYKAYALNWCIDTIRDLPSAQPEKVCIAKITLSEEQVREAVEKAKSEIVQVFPSTQPEQQWIPCSERYPDMDERVLVYTGAHEYHVWDCMSNRADNYFWEDEEGLYRNKYEASLWMPLPEPYRGEEK